MKKISFENKVLITFTVLLIVGLSAINVVSILFFKYNLERQLYADTKLYTLLVQNKYYKALPEYVRIFKYPPRGERYQILAITRDFYIALDLYHITKKVKEFAFILLLWEGVLILSTMSLFYFTIVKYIKREEYIKKYLEMIILAISHKLGNFLSSQRVNLDILKAKCQMSALERLEKAYFIMEKDFQFTIKTLKNIEKTEKNKEKVNLKSLIEEIINVYQQTYTKRRVILSLKEVLIYADISDLENILYPLVENAFKYSQNLIHIKLCKTQKNIYLFIKNDVRQISKGAGLGLQIASFLVREYQGDLMYRLKKNYLLVLKLPE